MMRWWGAWYRVYKGFRVHDDGGVRGIGCRVLGFGCMVMVQGP